MSFFETAPGSREVGSRVVDYEASARIAEHAIVDGTELSRCADHLRLDFDGCELSQGRTSQQPCANVIPDPWPMTAAVLACGTVDAPSRLGQQDLGRYIVLQRTAASGAAPVVRANPPTPTRHGLCVGGENQISIRQLSFHSHGCRPAILVEGVGELTGAGKSAETIDAAPRAANRSKRTLDAARKTRMEAITDSRRGWAYATLSRSPVARRT